MKWTIANKLIGGFTFIVLLLLITVYINFNGLQRNEKSVNLVTEVRTPTAIASYKALTALNESLASLRGWMLLNNPQFKFTRQAAFQELDKSITDMTELSANWTNKENLSRLKKIKENIEKFRAAQNDIEEIANSPRNIPSYDILVTKAAPLGATMADRITEMIDIEKQLDASPLRKTILGEMADVRGSLGLSLANIRAYLLSGDVTFKNEFDKLWTVNTTRFTDLSNHYSSLNAAQQRAFTSFSAARSEFIKYPAQMFQSREGEDWNVANYWLRTKAAPVAAELSATLNELSSNQQELLIGDNKNLLETSQAMKSNSIMIAIAGLILASLIAYFIIKSVTVPLNRMNQNIESIAAGDLTTQITTSGNDEIATAMHNMNEMVKKLKQVISSVISSSDNIADASGAMSATSQQMSQGTQEQAASAEEISSSMEQMASNIQQNTDNAQQTEKIALQAAEDIKEGSSAVSQTVSSMKKIAEKIGIIGEIARQTNLLALNAAVEAARAGEHGKGFAVVAAEVRKLAERSQIAAEEINELSSSSVTVADKSGRLLDQIVPNIQNTAKLVQEIAASSIEQNNGADQVNNAIQQFNTVIQQNAAGAEEMASSAEELASQAENLKDIIAFFKVDNIQRSSVRKQATPVAFHFTNGSGQNKTKSKIKPANKGAVIDLSGMDKLDNEYERF
jgi:methyl-accepting chemotaxis protein